MFRGGEFEPCLAGVGNLSWKSEGFKSWSMSRKSWLLILPLTKKLGGAFEHSFELGHANLLRSSNFKCLGSPRGGGGGVGVEVSHGLNQQSVTAYSHYK